MLPRAWLILLAAGLVAREAAADPMICGMVVFGDSLSDTGNDFQVTKGLFPATRLDKDGKPITAFGTTFDYTSGRFTNGPGAIPAATRYTGVWHEQLATMLGLPVATPSLTVESGGNGNNFAYGGARTSDGTHNVSGYTIVDMGQQVRGYLNRNSGADPSNLYVLWGGGNDLIDATRGRGATAQGVLDAERAAISNLVVEFKLLADSGATTFLWPDLPPLDRTPYAQGLAAPLRNALATASADFSGDEDQAIAGLEGFYGPKIKIVKLDDYSIISNIVASPGDYGYANATDPAQNMMVNPDQYLFWDNLHPTTRAHRDLAGVAAIALSDASVTICPEPSSARLIAVALPALLGVRAARSRSPRAAARPGS